jgi:hypothetical protein
MKIYKYFSTFQEAYKVDLTKEGLENIFVELKIDQGRRMKPIVYWNHGIEANESETISFLHGITAARWLMVCLVSELSSEGTKGVLFTNAYVTRGEIAFD